MAFVLTAQAVMRAIQAREDDPFCQWIDAEDVLPLIANVTIAQVLHAINSSSALDKHERRTYNALAEVLIQDLAQGLGEIALNAVFDLNTAVILESIMGIEAGSDRIGEFDLVAAAICIQHNHDLVVARDAQSWIELEAQIKGATGRLSLKTFDAR